jgi:pyroglutamyl-peptidase
MKIKSLILISTVIIVLTNTSIINSQTINLTNEEPTIVLVMGFGPFLNFSVNPSELIAAELDGEIINNAEIVGLQVQPNLSNFTESIEIVYQAIEDINPDYVFSIGLAAPYDYIRIEKIGLNLKIESRENATLEKLITNGRWIRISSFPAMKIVRNLRSEGIPSQTGLYAGLSLCNGMLYSVLHYVDVNDLQIKSGFIHVPLHKSEENPEGMELETMFNATRIIINVCLDFYTCFNKT